MAPFTIDPDVARAATIDRRFYLDEQVWRLAEALHQQDRGKP